MASKATFSSRSFKSSLINSYGLEMFFCLIVCFFFLNISNTKNSFFINFKYYVISFSEPGLKLVAIPFKFFGSSVTYFSELTSLKERNEVLESENKILRKKLNKSNFFEIENFRLKKLLDIETHGYTKKITSRILIDPYKSDDSIFFIDSGKKDGLKINDIVFNEYGMIGRVSELGDYSSKVLSIFDEDSVIPVISLETKVPFFIKGSPNRLNPKHIDQPFGLKHGETLITTNAAGYFTEGIRIGKVIKTLDEVYVEPFAKVSDSIYVNVLTFNFEKRIEW